jgi:uncharacterized membrane protein
MEESEPNWKNMVFYGVAWFIACLLLVLALLNSFELVRTILDWITASIKDIGKQRDFGWTVSAITEGMLFVGGVLAVGLAVWLEYFFRKGEKVGKLFQRVARVLITELVIIVVTIAARVAITAFAF